MACGVNDVPQGTVLVELGPLLGTALPAVGTAAPAVVEPLDHQALERATLLRLAHLRVELRLAEDGWRDRLERVGELALSLAVGLELALALAPDEAEAQ